ncbi:MAG: type II secretion system F family protein [Alphaproteobacteria bacterium]|nr:type II secretion system F family protein [Alphaproteobacteria bacterium]
MDGLSASEGLLMLVVLFGVGSALMVVTLAVTAIRARARLGSRIEKVTHRLEEENPDAPKSGFLRKRNYSSIGIFDRLLRRWLPNPAMLQKRLEKTGKEIVPGEYVLACVLLMVAVAILTAKLFGFPLLLSLSAGVVVGIGLPHLVVNFLISRWERRFTALFPEAIDLIVRGLKSGLPISDSLAAIGHEIGDPVGTEFRRIDEQMRMGQSLDEALQKAVDRIDTAEFKFFVISLAVQQETGGNLTETLENLSDILRRRRQMKMKVRAMSSEARSSAYIIGSLPFLMFAILYLMNAEYAMTLFTDPRGKFLLGAGLCSMGIGAIVMMKMVRFRI